MKHVLLVVIIITAIACSKNKERCWRCTTIKAYSNGTEENTKDTLCGKTESEIDNYEKINTKTVATGPSSSIKYTTACSAN